MASLSERLAALTDPEPAVVDKEVEDEDTVTGARVEEGEEEEEGEEMSRSRLRVATAGGLAGDARYQGRKGSRRTLDQDEKEHEGAELGHMFGLGGSEEESEEEDMEEGEGEEEEEEEREEKAENGFSFDASTDFGDYGDMEDEDSEGDDKSEEGGDKGDDGEESDDDEESDDADDDDEEAEKGVGASQLAGLVQRETNAPQAEKAAAVAAQVAAWDSLLEQRILLQKLLAKVNTFPQHLNTFLGEEVPGKEVQGATGALEGVVRQCGEVLQCVVGGSVEEQCGGQGWLGGQSAQLSRWLESEHLSVEPGRRAAIAMWGEKTARVGGFDSLHTPALTQVDQIMANPSRLVARTRVRRSQYRVLGGGGEQEEEDMEIFDDSDFYHQLLRELIDRKTSGAGESGQSGRQWLQIQKLRSKMKRKVDTRASKGRKVRYDIHSKLVNFMAPVTREQMSDTARTELFSSLFGVRKPARPSTAA